MNPKVSIIIPCYNQGHFLKETVESAVNSAYPTLEIIIVNDGSTDNSEEIAEQLTESYSNVALLNQLNSGVTTARNAGIEFASGKYILPLDGDDLIAPNYISEAVQVLEKSPKVKVVYCEAVKFNESGSKEWKLKPFSRQALAKDNMIFVSGIFRKSDCMAVGGFSTDMKCGREDWEFWIKMLKNGGEVVKLPFVGFYYRLHSGSKRKKTGSNQKKRERIAYLNKHHAAFFERELNGPLRFQRTWSKPYNNLMKWLGKL
ncbi:glycosyltransferase family A protein [Algoriphagus halophytocola]|uniref:Glycosyltransferase family 2 protein n=1 Tax=Algoriphagus halophytocola TaxID=2991499 RepID=A0ABY6MJ54_9BACT|nr:MULTISPECIES: glycosyltransferase family A protein [unclassified Algoriphagus]UZD22224.1 glycosyltransferase family 2 protein [Algoriphagus sp. TR-M5]WBL43474.1 glycosyltransferase family A protein [Algoriphagus sp. TR-M9]